MRCLLDTCVLYSSDLRDILLRLAGQGFFVPLWSPHILDEWVFTADHKGWGPQARIERALLEADWPNALVANAVRDDLVLPDMDDVPVLAVAIDAGVDVLVTLNTKDFPRRVLANLGVGLLTPDQLVMDCMEQNFESVASIVKAANAGLPHPKFLKSLKLPQSAKRLANVLERS